MFKKGLAILLALSVLLCLAACGESPAPAEATTPTPSPSAVPTEESVTPTPEPTAVPETSLAYHSTDAIRERGTLRVALQTENSKMSYFVPEGLAEFADRAGEPSGYVPWLCRQMAEDLGVALEFVFYDTAEQQLMSAQNGEVDFSANVWSITEERLERFTMTDNILVTGIEGDEVFLRADPEQPGSPVIDSEEALAAARIGAVRATVQATNAQLQYPEAEILTYDGNDAVRDALLAGEVDAAVFTTFDRAFADLLVEDIMGQLICQCEYQIVNPEIKGVGFVLMKGNDDLCDYLNERLTQYRSSGQLQEWNDLNETEAKAMGII